jgi:hypothetical protein
MRTDYFKASRPLGSKVDPDGKTWAQKKAEVLRAVSQMPAPSIKHAPDAAEAPTPKK